MTNAQYHARPEISASDLKNAKNGNTAAIYNRIWGLTPKKDPSPAMILGSAVHKLVLEPLDFETEFAVEPELNKRTNEGKAKALEFAEKNAGKTILSAATYEQAEKAAEAILNNPDAAQLLKGGSAEQSYFTELEGVMVKCRPDYFSEKTGICVDLKTTSAGVGREFAKDAANLQYFLQAAFYLDVLNACGFNATRFFFIVVNTIDFRVGIFETQAPAIETGRRLYQARLALWKRDLELGAGAQITDAYERRANGEVSTIQRLEMPAWATYEAESEVSEIEAHLGLI